MDGQEKFKITWCYLDGESGKMNLSFYTDDGADLETPHFFRLFDDDGILYFAGECSEEEFFPLDDYGAAFGCTEIRYMNKHGVYETL
jgi:hypothetical protein